MIATRLRGNRARLGPDPPPAKSLASSHTLIFLLALVELRSGVAYRGQSPTQTFDLDVGRWFC
jgi:hypothetical protein